METTLHQVPDYFLNPTHPLTINLIGVGGTGSHLLTKLAQVNYALKELDHPGFNVRAFDGDEVTSANVGRQSFFPGDIGYNKASVLIERINRGFGTSWDAVPVMFDKELKSDQHQANITITCVDSGPARVAISEILKSYSGRYYPDFQQVYYWLDLGNDKDYGQVVLGTVGEIKQPKKGLANQLPTIVNIFPKIGKNKKQSTPSCSVRESLMRQDLCMNSMMAEWGKKLIWSLTSEIRMEHQGVYVNLKTMNSNPIPIKG